MTDAVSDPTALAARTGLPEDLKLLLGAYPRRLWEEHPNFGPMTRFYLDRHAMFREALEVMGRQTQEALDRRLDPQAYARNFVRVANFFLGELTAHHQIEDHHFFPALARMEPRLARGFDMLETDHVAIHAALERFQEDANAMLRALAEAGKETTGRKILGGMEAELGDLGALLDRHLTDEEDLVAPIILDKGESELVY